MKWKTRMATMLLQVLKPREHMDNHRLKLKLILKDY